jgi:predicted amidohydrolase
MSRIATCAFDGTYDVEVSLKRHHAYLDEAADAGAELVVFPECSLQGYPPDLDRFYAQRLLDAWDSAESVTDGPSVKDLATHAADRGIHLIYGLNERGEQAGVIYNTMVLTGPDGHIGSYRKVHVGLVEQLTWRRGQDWPVFDTPLGRIGMLICYDKMWPESTRELTLRGADILVMSTAWCYVTGSADDAHNPWIEQYRLFDRARAVENSRWFVSSNFVGDLGGACFFGLSQIVDPTGRVVATTGTTDAGLAIADIDVAGGIAEAQARMFGPRLVRDRRDETYQAQRGEIPIVIDG